MRRCQSPASRVSSGRWAAWAPTGRRCSGTRWRWARAWTTTARRAGWGPGLPSPSRRPACLRRRRTGRPSRRRNRCATSCAPCSARSTRRWPVECPMPGRSRRHPVSRDFAAVCEELLPERVDDVGHRVVGDFPGATRQALGHLAEGDAAVARLAGSACSRDAALHVRRTSDVSTAGASCRSRGPGGFGRGSSVR